MKNVFRSEQIEEEAPKAAKKKKFHAPADIEEVEVKKLTKNDVKEASRVMRKSLFTVTDREVGEVIEKGMSYGAFVDRILVAVALSWGVCFNPKDAEFGDGEENAIFLEDDAMLLSYEGRGIRELLIEKREEEGKERNFRYAVAITTSINPEGEISSVVGQRGNKTEKALLGRGYSFKKTQNGVIAFREL